MTLQLTIAPETEAKLREHAAAAGKDIETFVGDALKEKLEAPGAEQQNLSPSQKAAQLRDWARSIGELVAKSVPAGHIADDSRESIYDDSIE
jgi:hypothetical protein